MLNRHRSPRKRVKRSPSVTSSRPDTRYRPLATLGKLSARKRSKLSVSMLKAGKMNLLSHAPDHPSAVLPNPPDFPVQRVVCKIMGDLPTIPSHQQLLQFRIIRKNPEATASSSLLFHNSDVATQQIRGRYKLGEGKMTLVGSARKMMKATTKSTAFKSSRSGVSQASTSMSEIRARSESTASQQSTNKSKALLRRGSKDSLTPMEVHFQDFHLSRLYDIKYSSAAPTKLSLIFHVEEDYVVQPTNGWPTVPEFDEIAMKFETNENLMKLLRNLLKHIDHTSSYLLKLYNVYLMKKEKDMVDEECESGRVNIDNAGSMLRASIDLAALARGSNSEAVLKRCNLLVDFIKDRGDNLEEAGFWKSFCNQVEDRAQSPIEPKSGLLEVLREELKSN